MTAFNNMDKRKKMIAFSLILLATAVLEFILIAALWTKDDSSAPLKAETIRTQEKSFARYDMLLAANNVLAGRLNSLQQSDKQYSGLLTESGDKKKLDSLNRKIYAEEEFFRGSIDSVFLNMQPTSDSALNKLAGNIIASYRSILQARQSIGSLRNAIGMDKKSLNPDEMAMLKSQNELQEKNSRIASLEATLKNMAASKPNEKVVKAADDADGNVAALQEDIKTQENKIAVLTALNSSLKQDNDKLLKQQTDGVKAAASVNEIQLKNKTAGLQQKVDALNAELSLAQVDCNLSRVDAAQIISNSKQRKQLLTEASGILTSLANSEDASIKKKVQDKIIRLNQVAANARE